MDNYQSSSIDIPRRNSIRIVASTNDGHTVLSSINTDGEEIHPHGMNTETGISPTYYTANGTIVQTSKPSDSCFSVGSPCFDDNSRVYFSHNSSCSCRGSGVGCECSKTCSC